MDPFAELPHHISELLATLSGQQLWGPFTTYTPFIVLVIAVVLIIIFAAKRQLSLVPKNRFVGTVDWIVEFGRKETAYGVLGPEAKPHVPFLLTLFIFILCANLIGIIPGSKAATGTMGVTFALTLIAFVYFTYYGIKHHGLGHYMLSFSPSGIKPFPLACFIWFLEFISMVLRLLTLSVRLFANMFAGHMLLGVLAILTQLFVMPFILTLDPGNLGVAGAGVLWFLLLTIMYAMELFVACLQAYVFTLLTSVYIMLATSEH